MKERDSFLVATGKFVLTVVLATAGATWTARGALANYETRITVLETRQDNEIKNDADAIAEIRTDLRELRTAMIENRGH